ncbi:MAG: hypothetical protein ACTSVB_05310 [Candidatus Heimdallarchaeaceae archaeon]
MSKLEDSIREHLVAIHILDEGINVHSEQLQSISNIDNVLLFGFLTALYNYTFAIGQEKILNIDLEQYKIIFQELKDNKLLVVITDSLVDNKNEKNLVEKIKLRYEVLTYDKDISEIDSLLTVEDGIIPLELIAEIRSKGTMLAKQEELNKRNMEIQKEIDIPKIKTEKFFFNNILDEGIIDTDKEVKIRKTLSNFFLGYKNLLLCIFAYNIKDKFCIFSFGRSSQVENRVEFSNYIINETLTKVSNKGSSNLKQVKYEGKKFWVDMFLDQEKHLSYVFLSTSKSELVSLEVHIKRISTFIYRLFQKGMIDS